jgi:pyruvate formate lyase activating enzyme
VDRTSGEVGVCQVGVPEVASRNLHPAPPESFTVFMAGCNFKCLHCQNADIAHYPGSGAAIDGPEEPEALAREGLAALASSFGRLMGADRFFWSGGEATCALPFVEEVVRRARALDPSVKVNFDTNGFATDASFRRILDLADSVTFDLRAVDDEVHRAMTGAPSAPVLRNAELMAEHDQKLWEFRILVVPEINEAEIEKLCRFVADLDPALPVAFLAFRPNFVLEGHRGATVASMERAMAIARDVGLRHAEWHGRPGLLGAILKDRDPRYESSCAGLAGAYAARAGCETHPRNCGSCELGQACPVKLHRPARRT